MKAGKAAMDMNVKNATEKKSTDILSCTAFMCFGVSHGARENGRDMKPFDHY